MLAVFTTNSSYKFFKSMLYNVLRRPMSFFDTTTNGEILNRFNSDIHQLEANVPNVASNCLDMLTKLIVAVVLVTIVVPILVVLVVIMLVFIFIVVRRFMRTTVELRRLNQLSISPMLSRISELYQGTVSLRTFGKTEWILSRFYKCLEASLNTGLHERMCSTWVGFRLDLSVFVISSATTFILTLSKDFGWNVVSGTDVVIYGTVLSNIYMIGNQMSFLMYTTSEIAKDMSSVQRIIEYVEYKE